MINKTRKKCAGQSTLEYAVLVIILIGALMAMQQYFRRGIMGRVRQATDDISDTQFDPAVVAARRRTVTTGRTEEVTGMKGWDQQQEVAVGETVTRLLRDEETQTATGAWTDGIVPEDWDNFIVENPGKVQWDGETE